MSTLRVSIILDASPEDVWADVSDISTHVQWMEDAASITFTSSSTSGVDTTFDCVTKVGPIRLVDKMRITQWEPNRAMGVIHSGIVTGDGVFTLTKSGTDRTEFAWKETLTFPWYMGGPIGAAVAVPILKLIWRRSLGNLSKRF